MGKTIAIAALALAAFSPGGSVEIRSLTLGISTNCPYGGIAE